MTGPEVEIKVCPMTLGELDAIFSFNRKIRGMGKVITYANLTTEHIFKLKL